MTSDNIKNQIGSEPIVEYVNTDAIYPWPRPNDHGTDLQESDIDPEKVNQWLEEYGQEFHGSEFLDDWSGELAEISEEWQENPNLRREIALENGRLHHQDLQEKFINEFQPEVTLRNEISERIEIDGHGLRLDGVSIDHNGQVDGKIIREYKTYPVSEKEQKEIARVTLEGAEQACWKNEKLEIWGSVDRSFDILVKDHLAMLEANAEPERDDTIELDSNTEVDPESSEKHTEKDSEAQTESEISESESESGKFW